MKRTLFLIVLLILLLFTYFLPFATAEPINSTGAQGLIGYAELGITTPRYRLWNETHRNFTAERTNAFGVGNNILWTIVRGSHERDELIMVTQDTGSTVDAQVFNATDNWTASRQISPSLSNTAQRAFDVAYESLSGDALLAYENSVQANNNVIGFTLWNGSNFSAEVNYSTTMTNNPIRWVELAPKLGSDHIMAIFHNGLGDISAVLWNGTNFQGSTAINLSSGTGSSTDQHFDFAWESSSGDGLIAYRTGATWTRRNFTASSGTWSAEESENLGQGVIGLRLCADPTSNYIGVIFQDGGNDVNVRIWNGSRILAGSPLEDDTTEAEGANNRNVDCVWTYNNTAVLFGFVDLNSLNMSYATFTKANESWSTNSLLTVPTTVDFASDDIEGLTFAKHPSTSEFMVIAVDIASDLTVAHWNGTNFNGSIVASPLETSVQTTSANQEDANFDWYRFDPQPTVRNLTLNTTAVPNLNEAINFTVNVTDNLVVDIVAVNITRPLGSVFQANLTRVGTIYNLTFTGTNETGTYTIRVVANDTSRHENRNTTETITFTAGDVTRPTVLNLTVNATAILQNELINISVNVTDNIRVSVVLVNITVPGLTLFDQYRMTNVSNALPEIFNLTFANTSRAGTYTVRIIANDTSSNRNDTQTVTFTVGDAIAPNVTQLTLNQTVLKVNERLNFTVNVSDNVRVDVVLVNVTVPNTTGFDQYRLTNITGGSLTNIFNLTFANTSRKGVYQIRVLANDTSGNRNITETINFSVGDIINPGVTLSAPVDRFNTSSTSISFQFTPTDNSFTTLSCNSTVDGVVNNTIAAATNNTLTSLEGLGFAEGDHNWNITCADGDGNQNTTASRIFTVDTSAPVLNALTNQPSGADALDPGVRIAFFANVSDNLTAVTVVRLQHKLTTVNDFTNVTMTLNTSNGLYEGAFTPTQNGTFNVRVYATDTVNNAGQSVVVNYSIQNEATWTRSPASIARGASPGAAISFVNVTINNTGDLTLNFTMTSSFANTRFNTTFPLQLLANETRIVEINITAPSTVGATAFQIQATASPNADPSSLNISATIAVTEGQPFLAATFTDIPSTKTKGDTFDISGQVQNIGTGNASNSSVFFIIPTDWVLIGGALNNSVGDLDVGSDAVSRTITVNIPSNATDGLRPVKINASGLNFSNSSLETLSLLSGDERTLNVTNATLLVVGPTTVPAVSETVAAAPIPSASVPSAQLGSVAGKLTPGISKELLETYETIYVVRGENTTFPLNITNIYNDTTLADVELEIVGYLAQYLTWQPEKLDDLSFAETQQFIVSVAAPGYKEREVHELNVTITGTLSVEVVDKIYNKKTKTYDILKRIERTKLLETRHVTLIILETSVLEATAHKSEAEQYLTEFLQKGIGTTKLYLLLTALNSAYENEQYAAVQQISAEITAFAAMVLETHEILYEARQKYDLLKEQGYDVEEWNGLLTLAEMAFAEENFESAYLRAKEAQLYQAVAVEQQFNLGAFLLDYWQELLVGVLATISVGYFTKRRIFLLTVDTHLRQLDAREEETELLKEEAQRACFTQKKISTLVYHKRMYQYELLLDTIRKKRYALQKKKERLMTGEEILLFLRRDNAHVLEMLKNLQEVYYNKGTIPKSEYTQKTILYKNHLAENEKDAFVIEEQLNAEQRYKKVLQKQLLDDMKDPKPLQVVSHATHYFYLCLKDWMKEVFFYLRYSYDLLLLKCIENQQFAAHVLKEKNIRADLAILEELLLMKKQQHYLKNILYHLTYNLHYFTQHLKWRCKELLLRIKH